VVPAGVVSHTGLGGLALGGGVGWTFRNFGLTCDNIVAAEVVTADGAIHFASETEDADLLWALRGGGGNFGVVTAFDLTTHPLAEVLFGQAVYPIDDLPHAMAHYVGTMADAPDELTAICIVCGAPPLPGVPPELVGRPAVMINAVWSGEPDAGAGPLRELIHTEWAAGVDILPMRYPQVQSMQDHLHPHGRFNYNKSRYLDRVDDAAVKALLEAGRALPGRHCQVEVLRLGGAAGRVPADATAFAHRDAAYILNVVAAWTEAADETRTVQWARDTYAALDCVGSQAGYINFLELEPDRVLSVYPPATYERLRKIKRRLDPDNVFHGNVPIEPAR
jgi:FAD/FMN-containing dehydrogenase